MQRNTYPSGIVTLVAFIIVAAVALLGGLVYVGTKYGKQSSDATMMDTKQEEAVMINEDSTILNDGTTTNTMMEDKIDASLSDKQSDTMMEGDKASDAGTEMMENTQQ